jgi:hypothetical protein
MDVHLKLSLSSFLSTIYNYMLSYIVLSHPKHLHTAHEHDAPTQLPRRAKYKYKTQTSCNIPSRFIDRSAAPQWPSAAEKVDAAARWESSQAHIRPPHTALAATLVQLR